MISVSRPAAAGLIAVAAVSLAACHPPHQVDSDQKIDTATSQKAESLASYGATTGTASATASADDSAATGSATSSAASETETETPNVITASDGTPTIANCGDVELERPTQMALDCQDQENVLQNIEWDTWEDDVATGIGTLLADDAENEQPGVTISLSNPQVVNGVLAYTDITVDGSPVYPEGN